MQFHRNAKLGLAGRFALVQSIEGGCSIRVGCGQVWGIAGDGSSLVASLARVGCAGTNDSRVFV